jgi:organic radical activating enzyme
MVSETQRTARLIEVFSAIQGEGLHVGTREIFVRFASCDLRCHFCDSVHTWGTPSQCRVESTPGRRDFATHPNPVSLTQLLKWVERQNSSNLHERVSLTGGEPLLQAPFLAHFLPQLRRTTPLPIYLETGGHRPQQLAMVLPYLDSVGMDIKLPSVSGETKWQEHARFLQLCSEAGVEVFVKLIVDRHTNPVELEQAARLVAQIDSTIPAFLQPATPEDAAPRAVVPPSPEQVLTWQALLKSTLQQVRVVPQTHKFLAQL